MQRGNFERVTLSQCGCIIFSGLQFCGYYQIRERYTASKRLLTFNQVKHENASVMGEKIIKLVTSIRQGMGQAVVISPDRAYLRPKNNAFKIDHSNLSNDTRKIGKDLKKKLKQYSNGEPSYQR